MTEPESMTRHIERAGWIMAETVLPAAAAGALVTAGPDKAEGLIGARRGILAAVAHEAGMARAPAGGDRSAAMLAVAALADGYYDARPTFGRGQALAQAAEAANRWMFASHGLDATQPGLSASLSTLVFSGARVGMLQIGSGLILRVRSGEVIRLTSPQLLRIGPDLLVPRRALGHDSRVLLDYQEDTVLARDRYILLSDSLAKGRRIDGPELLRLCRAETGPAALAAALAHVSPGAESGSPQRSVIILDIESLPEPSVAANEASLSELPLAPVPQEGENKDGYLIGRTLHRGAYTLLKHAVDTRTREPVVLKFPLPAMLNDRVFQAGFARESWIGTSIHSPVIGRVLPAEPGRRSSLYIVMPYYRGETLESRMAHEPRFALPEIVAIGLQLAQAVEDLRAVQVLHRDLKPDNVMLLNGGGLRLLDLGLAYLAGTEASAAQGLAGTIRYMAPELLRGAAPDDRTEVYALGVILYRLAAYGRFPRPGADLAASLRRQRPDLPPRLCAAIAAAMEGDPARRPQHAGLLAHALSDSLQEGAGNRVTPRRLVEPLALWRAAAIALGLALVAALALR
jgi:hypothetical protein